MLQQLYSSIPRNANLTTSAANNVFVSDEDPHFSNRTRYGDTDLNRMSPLSNTIESLATLALNDWEARIPGFHGHAPAPHVIIVVTPASSATDIPNEVAVSCIHYGVLALIMEAEFKEAEFDCRYDGASIASVFIDTTQTYSTFSIGNVTQANNISTTSLNATENDFNFVRNAKTLTIWEVYIMILVSLKAVAKFPSSDAVKAFVAQPAEQIRYLCDAYMLFVGESIRITPPYFEYKLITEALRQLPSWLHSQGRFAEVGIGIVDGRTHLGSGLFMKGTYEPEVATN